MVKVSEECMVFRVHTYSAALYAPKNESESVITSFFFFSFLQFHQCNVYSIILQQMNLLVCNCVFPIFADSAIAFLNKGGKRMIGCCINQCPFIYLFQTKPLWQNTMHTVMGACVGSPF